MPLLEGFDKVFQIKPIITLAGGQLKFAHALRSFRKGMDFILRQMTGHKPASQLAVVHTRCPEHAATFADELSKRLEFERSRIIISEAGAVMSTHGGAGLVVAVVVSAQ
jgi:fatty acid-binding protein DegV